MTDVVRIVLQTQIKKKKTQKFKRREATLSFFVPTKKGLHLNLCSISPEEKDREDISDTRNDTD